MSWLPTWRRGFELALLIAAFLIHGSSCAQIADSAWVVDLGSYWAEINAEYADSSNSPLLAADRSSFTELERFAPDPTYRVTARFKAREGKEFGMSTTTDRRPVYKGVGELRFKLHGTKCRLTVYQNRDLVKKPEYADHLFLPFTDLTNGESTYGGGRYLDLKGPLGKEVTIDLNKAYNPYCAYGGRYSCPIVPAENHLEVAVEAGVKAFAH